MRKAMITLVVFLGWVGALCAESKVTVTPKVQLEEKRGDTDAYIGPVYFPDFYDNVYKSERDAPCADYLKELSNKKMYLNDIDEKGFLKGKGKFLRDDGGCKYCCHRNFVTGDCNSVGPIKTKTDNDCRGIDVESGLDFADEDNDGNVLEDRPGKVSAGEDEYYGLAGLSGELNIKPDFETQGKILFSWVVRVEGFNPEDVDHYTGEMVNGIAVWPVLCERWRGTSHQDYSGGQVKTQLYVLGVKTEDGRQEDEDGYAAVGEPVEMTIPAPKDKVTVVSHMPPPDPTLTGSFLLKPGDFPDDKLPSVIYYRLKWSNHSAIRIKSPKNQRNLEWTLMPVTQE